jgi:hypothetical protein
MWRSCKAALISNLRPGGRALEIVVGVFQAYSSVCEVMVYQYP